MILLDTNILVYAINVAAPQHEASRAVVEAGAGKRIHAVLVPQVLLEFYAVITNYRQVTSPLDPETAWQQVEAYAAMLPVLDGGLNSLSLLGDEIRSLGMKGQDVFDAYLVAQMRALGISTVCTYNLNDLTKFKGIVVETPERLLDKLRID